MSTKQKDTDQLDPTGGNVEQIREILFGGHIRAFDERFDLVEARLSKESNNLRKALEKRVLELERLLGDFREEAGDQLNAESSSRDLALNKVELAMASARMDAENQMAEMQDRHNADLKTLKADQNAAMKALGAELKAAHKELTTAINKNERTQERRSEKLDHDKVTRKDLSNFLTDVAKKLQPAKPRQSK
jgi:chromosome segregation ATPase